jgi:hypothetical protein
MVELLPEIRRVKDNPVIHIRFRVFRMTGSIGEFAKVPEIV